VYCFLTASCYFAASPLHAAAAAAAAAAAVAHCTLPCSPPACSMICLMSNALSNSILVLCCITLAGKEEHPAPPPPAVISDVILVLQPSRTVVNKSSTCSARPEALQQRCVPTCAAKQLTSTERHAAAADEQHKNGACRHTCFASHGLPRCPQSDVRHAFVDLRQLANPGGPRFCLWVAS
jgi:hypothetical protein